MEDWNEIRAWRRTARAELLSRRLAVPRAEKLHVRSTVHESIIAQFPELYGACVGFYWPFKGEIDLRHLVREFMTLGAEAALPVVVEKRQPLEFWVWRPRMKLRRGIWNIPIPAERTPVRPTALLVPLLGFDEAGYRLGYGGGYYDRTLATLNPKPLTVGVGYELGRLTSIHPQAHDIPLDVIVTEAGCARFRYHGAALSEANTPGDAVRRHVGERLDQLGQGDVSSYASPPCFMHELDPAYLGYMATSEVLALLNKLLEGERAGARAVAEMSKEAAAAPDRAALREIAKDEARFCAVLSRHIVRLGGTPSPATGTFYEKLMALQAFNERIDLLDRGQAWVVRKLQEALPRIGDDALYRDLTDMLMVHENNIRRCAELR